MERIAITDEANKYLKIANRGRTENKQWSDVYRALIELIATKVSQDQAILALTGCSSLTQLARRIYTPAENDRGRLDIATIARELGKIDGRADIKRKRRGAGGADDLKNQAE